MKFAIEATYTVKVSAMIHADSLEEAEENVDAFETMLFLGGRYGDTSAELEECTIDPLPDDHDPVEFQKLVRRIG